MSRRLSLKTSSSLVRIAGLVGILIASPMNAARQPGVTDSLPAQLHEDTQLSYDSTQPPILGNTLDYGIDTSISPCEDFYGYANGGWRKSYNFADTTKPQLRRWGQLNNLPVRINKWLALLIDSAHTTMNTTDDPLLRAVGTFYESCLVADSLEIVPVFSRPKNDTLKRDSTRSDQCISRTKRYLGGALGQSFGQSLEENNSVSNMKGLLEGLKAAAHNRLGNHTLLTVTERENAQERLKKLFLRVGIPEVKADYSGLKLSPSDYFGNKDAIANFNTMSFVGQIGSDLRNKWLLSLFTPNALYNPGEHAIEIPTAMFNRPFFDVQADDPLNYGGVGYVIGHEMFHGLTPVLDLAENPIVKEQIDSFKAFNSSQGTLDGWSTNGHQTYQEDIADLGGIRTAYDAWQLARKAQKKSTNETIDGFTPEQRFFLGLANVWRAKWTPESASFGVHAAYFARVNAAVMQMPEFTQAFGCKAGDKMFIDPNKMSSLW